MTQVMQTRFDYSALPQETAIALQLSAERIRIRMKRTAEDIIAIGQELIEAKQKLQEEKGTGEGTGFGKFGKWLKAEFEMAERTAQNFMQVAERFGDKSAKFADLSVSILYQLASPSTPDSVVEAVIDGEIEPTIKAVKEELRNEALAADPEIAHHPGFKLTLMQLKEARSEVAQAKRDAREKVGELEEELEAIKAQYNLSATELDRLRTQLKNTPEKIIERIPEHVAKELIERQQQVRTAQENARQQEALAAKAKERFDEAKREAEQLREEAQRLRRELAAKQLELETISEEHRQHKAALETRDMLARLIRNLIAECNSVHRMRFTPQQIEMFDDNSYQHIDNAIRVLQETVTLLSSYTQHHYIDGEVING